MGRPPRLELPDVPLHVVQRGNNRAACFFNEVDRRFYLKCLATAALARGCAIHAYVLMTNHVHLLVTPSEAGAVGAMMQDVGRRYVRVINSIHGRTGSLWEGRFKSSLIDSESYLLTCHRYIELNPVRARMASDPRDYPWSSYRAHAFGAEDGLVSDHRLYRSLQRPLPAALVLCKRPQCNPCPLACRKRERIVPLSLGGPGSDEPRRFLPLCRKRDCVIVSSEPSS